MTLWSCLLRTLALAVACCAGAASAQELLRTEIDRLLAGETSGAVAHPASDAEFLRRVSLDLIGMPPSAEELQAFLADSSPTKREATVDRLLASPHYARNMATVFDIMLMERRPNANVSADDWQRYLFQSFLANKPLNVLAKEILAADGVETADPMPRFAARFYLDRNGEPNLIARDVGRIFFGRDMQCAQCHDHPLIADYFQTDYHGLLAFYGASSNLAVKKGEQQITYFVEKAPTDGTFESVFIKGTKHLTRPKLPGEPELVEPAFYPGDEYQIRPAENVAPVPKYSRRAQLAELATNGSNRAFNENFANRLWGHMLGRGLVSPPDLHHSGNPATHPELLKRLSERLVEMKFDVKAFLKEVALSEAYQRSMDQPADLVAAADQAAGLVPQVTTTRDALAARVKELQAASDLALTEWAAAEAALLPILAERDAARNASNEVVKKVDEAQKVVNDTQAQLNLKMTVVASVSEAATKAQEAIKLLPTDQELAAAAAKFSERVGTLNGEVEALKKTVEEKTAAVSTVNAELVATRPAIDAAQAKVAPLEDVCRTKYNALAAARRAQATEESRLASVELRLKTLTELVATKTLREQIAAAEQAVVQQQAAADAAVARQTEITPTLLTSDANHQQAVREAGTLTAAVAAARQEHATRQDALTAVNAAVKSADEALAKLPQDAALTEAGQKLRSRSDELTAGLAEHQKAVDAAVTAETSGQERLSAARAAFEEMIAERGRRVRSAEEAVAAVSAAGAQVATLQTDLGKLATELQTRWSNDTSIAALKPLSPEQFCASIFKTTGIYENYRAAEVAELDKTAPLSDADKQDPAKVVAREREIEQRVYDKLLKANYPTFVGLFGAGAGQPQGDFFASADQALYTANGGSVIGWSGPNGNNVTTQIVNEPDLKKAAERLYLSVLSRLPTEDETKDVETYLTARADQKAAAAQELVWGLIASVEFRLNH